MATTQCSICLDDFKQPKFLDCHHTFCLECIRGLENKTPGFINCPICRREIQLPSGGVEKLCSNFYIQPMMYSEDLETVLRWIEDGEGLYNDTPMVGVEGIETVPTGVENGENDSPPVGVEGKETLLRGVENVDMLQNDTPSVGVEVAESVPTGVENGENDTPPVGVEGAESVPTGVENGDSLQNAEHKTSERKTIMLDFPAENFFDHGVSFGGVPFKLHLFKHDTNEWGETLALLMYKSPFVISCEVEYDITLVNRKDKKFSTKRTGQCNFETVTYLKVDLIKMEHAVKFDYGFISLDKPRSRCRKDVDFFNLDIYISVSNIKYIDFNLK